MAEKPYPHPSGRGTDTFRRSRTTGVNVSVPPVGVWISGPGRWNAAGVEKRVHFITLATADLDAARAFYSDGLGWEPLVDVPGEIIFFQVGPGLVLGLFDKVAFDGDINGDNDGESNGSDSGGSDSGGSEDARPRIVTDRISGITLSLNVDSPAAVDEVVSTMVAAGGVVLKRPTQAAFGGYHGHVQDPNGVIWEIAHNPGWRVDDTGRVFLE